MIIDCASKADGLALLDQTAFFQLSENYLLARAFTTLSKVAGLDSTATIWQMRQTSHNSFFQQDSPGRRILQQSKKDFFQEMSQGA